MRRLLSLVCLIALVVPAYTGASAAEPQEYRSGTVYAEVTDDGVTVGNDLVERTWTRTGWATTSFTDKRSGSVVQGGAAPDFTLDVGLSEVASDVFNATSVTVEEIPGGLSLQAVLVLADGTEPALAVTRTIEVYEGIAGMRTQTTLNSAAPLVLRGYTIEQAAVGNTVAPTIHAFRAGADWREPDWAGPCDGSCSLGDPHAGTWRDSRHRRARREPRRRGPVGVDDGSGSLDVHGHGAKRLAVFARRILRTEPCGSRSTTPPTSSSSAPSRRAVTSRTRPRAMLPGATESSSPALPTRSKQRSSASEPIPTTSRGSSTST